MKESSFFRGVQFLAMIVLIYLILVTAKPFLVPLVFAGLFSMLMLPLSMKLERKGWNRGIATVICILLLIFSFALVLGLLGWQVADLSKNADQIEQNLTRRYLELKQFIASTFGISQEKQEAIIQEQRQKQSNWTTNAIKGSVASLGSIITNIILVIVYMFLFLYFRTHLKNFILMRVKKGEEERARDIMQNGRKVAQKYLTGLAMMIATLWVLYGIGFSISGVRNALFFAVLCGLLEIIPFVGNLIGVIITLFMSLAQGGDNTVLIGIVITYGIVQFFQTYFLEPLVVGREVNVHPLFTIVGLVLGEFIWGIPGMILAIPVMGVMKIVFDNIESLKPYGYLLGEPRKDNEVGLVKKIKSFFKSRKKGR